jgi:hypothetical protein
VTEIAREGDENLLATVLYFKEMERINPDFLWVIENPQGYMRKQKIMEDFTRHEISYCHFGMKVQKHTDLWSNMKFNLPPICDGNRPGHLNHQRVMDQTKEEISVVPPLLARTIVDQMIREKERREIRQNEVELMVEADQKGEVAEQANYLEDRGPLLAVEPLKEKKEIWPSNWGIPDEGEPGEEFQDQDNLGRQPTGEPPTNLTGEEEGEVTFHPRHQEKGGSHGSPVTENTTRR